VPLDYVKAGVDLSKHREMHRIAAEAIAKVAGELGAVVGGLGSFAPHLKLGGLDLALHADGVGTKTLVLKELGTPEVAGWDCVAMNVNDLACGGFRVVAISDYVAMGEPDVELFRRVISGIASAARYVRAPIVSGETAILPGLVRGLDVVCFTVGTREVELEGRAKAGDVVVGVESWGLHANGFSLVRKIVEERVGSYRATVGGVNLAEELVKPTAIYYDLVLEAAKLGYITSATHVTGGGWSKARRALGGSADMVLEAPRPPKVFEVLLSVGEVPVEEAYRVFNMGIGLILTARPEYVDPLLKLAELKGFKAHILGEVVPGRGLVHIEVGWYGGSIAV